MDQFQVDFFKTRSSQWEPYLDLRQKAARVFFLLSFLFKAAAAQAAAGGPDRPGLLRRDRVLAGVGDRRRVSESRGGGVRGEGRGRRREFFSSPSSSTSTSTPSPSNIFEFVPSFEEYCEAGVEEGCPESGKRKVVRSSPLLLPAIGSESENENDGNGEDGETDLAASLWAQQRAAAGDLIYARIAAGSFRDLEFRNVPKPPQRLEEVKGAAEALAAVFVENGFALKQTVSFSLSSSGESDEARTAVVSLRLDGPADLWATGALSSSSSSSQNSSVPAPAFAGIALGGMLRASEALVVGQGALFREGGRGRDGDGGELEGEREAAAEVKKNDFCFLFFVVVKIEIFY